MALAGDTAIGVDFLQGDLIRPFFDFAKFRICPRQRKRNAKLKILCEEIGGKKNGKKKLSNYEMQEAYDDAKVVQEFTQFLSSLS